VNVEQKLLAMRDLVQNDIGNRGLRRDPAANLITACADDFVGACRNLAETPRATVKIITGFYIPHAQPPAAETDGPLGAVFLARALVPLGIQVILETDAFCTRALRVGLDARELADCVPVLEFPLLQPSTGRSREEGQAAQVTHLIALERCGPSHNQGSLVAQFGAQSGSPAAARLLREFLGEVPEEQRNRYYTMSGLDVTETMRPAHLHFETAKRFAPPVTTIGIGDGGNEIGMGKIPWDVIRRNIPGGGLIACRVPTDYLIVAGVSNWGAYALAAGVSLLRGQPLNRELFDVERERRILRIMVEQGPLVDGVTGESAVSIDGLPFERYAEPLRRMALLH